MPFCSECGYEMKEDAKFCIRCGKVVEQERVASQRETVYDGQIHKCPNCGDVLDAYECVCESCGYERRGARATSSVRELQQKLEILYAKRPPRKTQFILAHAFANQVPSSVDEEIINLIKNFSIPNNKEDVMEFIVLASSNIDIKVYGLMSQRYQMLNPAQREISDAWLAKFEQAYQKALLMFGHSPEFANIQLLYEKREKEIQQQKKQLPLFVVGIIVLSLLPVALTWLLVFLTGAI